MVRRFPSLLELGDDRPLFDSVSPMRYDRPVLTIKTPTRSRMNRSFLRHHEFQMNLSIARHPRVDHLDDRAVLHPDLDVGSLGETRVMGHTDDAASFLLVQLP